VLTGTTAGAPEAPGDEAAAGGRGDRRGATTPAAVVGSGTATREWGRRARPAALPEPPGERTRSAARDTRAPRGAGWARPSGRGMRRLTGRHAAGAARCAWACYSPSSVMIASGDLTCMEGIICIGW